MQNYFDSFQEVYPHIQIEKNFDFKRHTTIGIGGHAPLAVFPKNYQELESVVQYCLKHFVPYYPLGKGSNILVADTGYQGIVLVTSKMQTISLQHDGIYVEAGVSLAKLVQFAKEHSFDGYIPLLGFPATVGGAIYMNAGVKTGYIGDLVQKVYAIDKSGKLQIFDRESCQFSYKQTAFMQNKAIIAAALLQTNKADSMVLEQQVLERKLAREHLPKERSMGCVFKNFEDITAGQLIDLAGCKGLQVGDAKVSMQHANFIINIGNALAKDVAALIEIIKDRVYKKFKRRLKEEIEYVGEF